MFRTLDENGDFNFGKGQNDFATNEEAIRLDIRTRILSWLNDCFFDVNAGVDWKRRLDKGQQNLLLNEVRSVITKTNNVVRLDSFDFSLVDRRIRINYTLRTIFSTSVQDEFSGVV